MNISKINNLNFSGSVERDVTILQPHGIHVRPAGLLIRLSQLTPQDIYIQKENKKPENIKHSLISILLLELQQGEKIKVIVDDTYPKSLLDAITSCLGAKSFEENVKLYQDFIDNIDK